MEPGSPPRGGEQASFSEPEFVALIAEAKRGSGPAFEQLYRIMAPRVANYAGARGADAPEAVANEVLARVFERIDRFDGGFGPFVTWILILARKLVDAGPVEPASARAGRSDAPGQQMTEDIQRRLEALSDDQRDVILLRMVGGLSLEQVALVVDKPVTAVRALQRRGLRRLHNEILREVVVR